MKKHTHMKSSFLVSHLLWASIAMLPAASSGQTNLGVTIRHAPSFNGPGRVEGSAQQFLGEQTTFNSSFTLTGDMYLPGTPSIVTHGSPSWSGVVVGSGSASPSGYQVILNGGVSLRYVRTRINAGILPTVPPPPLPSGTRSVTINLPGQSIGDPATLKHLTLNGSVGQVYVPPGTYGNFTANAASGFTLGIANTTTVYNLQSLTLNGATTFLLNGPVILTIANGFTANGLLGTTNHSSWLQLQLSSGGVTLNGGCTLHGRVVAPAGTVVIHGNSVLVGSLASDRLTIDGNGKIIVGGDAAANQPPVANAQSVTLNEDATKNITLTAIDPENAPLTYIVVSQPTRGALTGTAPDLVYRPNTNANGADSFTFKANDGAQDSAVATISITITPVNDAPIAQPQSLSTAEDTVAPITLTGSDVEGSTLTFAIVTPPQHGTLEGTPPSLTYVPSNNFNGADSFTFRVNDGATNSAPAAVSITIVPINDRPVADAQTVATDEDAAKTIMLTGEDPEYDSLSYTVVTSPAHGTLSGTAPNLIYQPAPNFFGTDSFNFKVSDGSSNSTPTNVNIIVRPINDAPVATNLGFTLFEDNATNLVLTATDVDSTNLNYTVVAGPGHGTLTPSGSTFIYSPAGNYFGADSFTFTANDGALTSAVATVSLTITLVNDTPIADAKNIQTDEDTPKTITLTGSDVEGDPLTFTVTELPAHGTLSGTAPDLTYTPTNNYFGADTFSYVAHDGESDSAPANVAILVTPTNRAPLVSAGQNQLVILPTNVLLQATVVDDALPLNSTVTVRWVRLMGPTNILFDNPSLTNATVTFTAPGNYVLRLTAHDGALTNYSDVTFVVRSEAMNEAPLVNAGTDKTVGLTNRLLLEAFAGDDGLPRGSALAVQWSKLGGPGEVTFENSATASTHAIFSQPGTYILQLTASDSLLGATDQVSIVVYPHNQPPLVDAGTNQSIFIPDPAVLAAGPSNAVLSKSLLSGRDWNMAIAHPGLELVHNQVSAASPSVNLGGLNASGTNVYVSGIFYNAGGLRLWTLARWDGQQWNPVRDANPEPSAAGPEIAGFVPNDSTGRVLQQAVRGDEVFVLGSRLRDFNHDGHVDTMARFTGTQWLQWGPNSLQQPGASAVAASPNAIYFGAFMDVQPTNDHRGICSGCGLLPGLPVSHGIAKWTGGQWEVMGDGISGEISAIAVSTNDEVYVAGRFMNDTANGIANNIAKWTGTRWERLGAGLIAPPNPNGPPPVFALVIGPDGFLYAGGSFTNAGGLSANYIAKWDGTNWFPIGAGAQNGLNAPAQAIAFEGNDMYVGGSFTMAGGFPANNIARCNGQFWSPLRTGTNNGVTSIYGDGSGTVNALAVTPDGLYVGGEFKPATAEGINIALWEAVAPSPQSVVLNGRVIDDGLPAGSTPTAVWTKASGPGNVSFDNIHSASTSATFDQLGTYVLRLTGSDSDLSAYDEVTIEVRGNAPPVVNAGPDFAIAMGETAVLQGVMVDDGLPVGGTIQVWSQFSGPYLGIATIQNSSSTNATVTFNTPGVYVLRLTANDSQFSTFDDVAVTVLSPNAAPSVSAYVEYMFWWDERIFLPDDAVIHGHADDDGEPSNTLLSSWSVVSGPGRVEFGNANAADTFAHFLFAGTYVLRFSANDSQLSAFTDVTVEVIEGGGGNQTPFIYAGPDQTISLPNPASLQAVLMDDHPENVSIFWSWLLAPAYVEFDSPGSTNTLAHFTKPGVYELIVIADDACDIITITVLPGNVNQPPSVYAGPTTSILITNQPLQLRGEVSDDGLPAPSNLQVNWSAPVGAGAVTFADSNATNSEVTFATAGFYELLLTATDGARTSYSWLDIYVVAPGQANQAPMVSAGPDVTVTMPQGVPLTASASDDGLPGNGLDLRWRQVHGPGFVSFSGPFSLSTMAYFSEPGDYVINFSASDSLLFNSDNMIVHVLPPTNAAPLAYAGPFQNIFLPTNTTTLAAVVYDDGAVPLVYSWSVHNAPGEVVFADSGSLTSAVTFVDAEFYPGWPYTLKLTVNDGPYEAEAFTTITFFDPNYYNAPPVVDAGPDEVVPFGNFELHGNVSDDGNPIGFYLTHWNQVAGPSASLFNSGDLDASVSPQSPGVYVFRLTALDFEWSGADDVIITVGPPSNARPTIIAGPSVTISLQDQPLVLQGIATDDGKPDGSSLTNTWSLALAYDGGSATFSDSNSATSQVTFSAVGHYRLQLTGTDGVFVETDSLDVYVIDGTDVNLPPTVFAGTNISGTVGKPVGLFGFVSDDGKVEPIDIYWDVVSGPGYPDFADYSSPETTATFHAPGVYRLTLNAYDGVFADSDDIVVTIAGIPVTNSPPIVHAGFPQRFLIENGATLSGAAFDDGLPGNSLSTVWSVVTGPGSITIGNATQSVTAVTFAGPGDYIFRLTASDGELTNSAEVTLIAVGSDANQAPIVSAGPDRSALVATLFSLNGTVTDDNSSPIANWSQISGPAHVYFTDANATQTTARAYLPGTYVLRLSANDGHVSAFDDVTVTITAPTNAAPIVLAGGNLIVVRPHAAELFGFVFDDGLPLGYPLNSIWSKVSGPGTVTFAPNANQQEAQATFSAAGNYVLRLTAEDSQFTDYDEIHVVVINGTNEPPVIVMTNQLFATLSTPLVLESEVTDDGLPNGTVQITWSKVSGPGGAAFSSLNRIYRTSFDTAGDYVIRIIADDSELRATNDVSVTVYDVPNGPTVGIFSPIDSAIITAPTIVTGLVQSPVLQSYVLQYRFKTSDDSSKWIPLSAGTVPVNNGPLGTFDPTLLLNGIYELQLIALDTIGRAASTEPVTVIVDRNMKVGNFTLSFNDLTIPVAGIPIQVIRTYDSRDQREGDLGVGWTLQLKDIRLQKNRHLGKAWDQSTSGGLFPSYCIDTLKPRIVTITFPDNKVYKFQAGPAPVCQFGVPLIYPRMAYAPLENTRGTLRPVMFNWHTGERLIDDQLVFAGAVPGRADFVSWELLLDPPPGPADNILYNPDLFEFTTLEGYTYLISETNGLRSMTDPNGNTLLITTNGITWTNAANSATLAVQFQRDALGRITNILDAMDHAMSYRYDTNGNLVTFTDREGNTNGFRYSPQHQLLAIADARGIEGVRNEYDDSGRLIRHIDANGKQINYAHDLDHRLEIITNRLGFVTISEYDVRGNVVRVTDANSAVVTSVYDPNDNLVMTIDPLGRTNTFTYDGKDNRTSVTDALGHITRVTYNDMRRVTSATDARGNTITNRYDRNGNLLWVRDPVSGVTAFSYDDNGLPVAMTNALGAVTRSEYNEFGLLTNRIDALGHSSQFAYDFSGRVIATTTTRSMSSGFETLTMLNRYDAAGRLTNVVFPDGTQQRTVFNSGGRIAQMVDQLGRVTAFEYDDQGRTTRVIYPDGIAETAGYDAESRVTAKTNRMGFVTRYEYDAVGRVVRTINPDGSSSTNYYDARGQIFAVSDPLGRTAFFGYDALGRVTSVTNSLGHVNQTFFDSAGNLAATLDPAGRKTEFFYDALNRRTNTVFADGPRQITFYDPMGRRSAEQDAAGQITRFGYDDLGRLVSVTNALGEVTRNEFNELGRVVAQVDALGRRTTFEHDMLGRVMRTVFADGTFQRTFYDALGRRTAETDAATNTTWFGYDTIGRLVAITNALGYVTRYEHDDLGRRTAQIDANNHRTAFEYDSLGRRTKRTLPGGEVENYFYDFVGNLTNRTDFNGYTTTFIHDELNRLVAKVPDARRAEPVIAFAYNELGLRTNMIDASGVTAYRYDNRNRLVQKATPQGTLFYSYDTVGSVTNIRSSNANGANLSYTYDELHRLQEVNDPHAGRTPYTYDPVGNLHSLVHANGVLNFFEYDSLNRLTNVVASAGFITIANYRYAVNPVGFRISATETLGGILGNAGMTISRTYGYDPLYRLTNETISVSSQNAALDYSYDAVGNRLSLHSTLGVIPSAVCSYTPNDRLNSDAYDNNGNTIGAALRDPFSGVSYDVSDSYDFENRVIRRVENGKTISFVYDGDGNRVKKTVTTATNAVTTWFLVDTVNPTGYAQVLEEITFNADDPHFAQPAVSGVYTYGHALLSQQRFVQGAWQLSFYGQDGHSSVRYLTDNHGFVTDGYDYDAFGNLIARSGTTPNCYLFTSEHYDFDLNLYYLRARYHDPQRGRFWSMDSLEGYATDPPSLHKYTYCANNPVNAFDPSGNELFLAGSVHTVALGLVARTTLYSTLGFITGTVAGGYDAIWDGRIRDEQIGAAMRDGGREGAIVGAFYGMTSWYGGPVVRAGWGMIGLMYGAAGALGAAESYANGYNRGGTFRLALGALSALGGAFDLYATLNSYHASISAPGDRTRQAFSNFKEAVDAGQASMAEEPAIVKIYMERFVIEQEIHVPPGSVPVRVLSGNPGKIAIIGRSMARIRAYAAELKAKGLDVEIFDGGMISDAALKQFEVLREEAKLEAPDGRLTPAQIRQTKMFQENRAWAEKLKREGYTVLDLGKEPGDTPSPFYELEGQEIFGD